MSAWGTLGKSARETELLLLLVDHCPRMQHHLAVSMQNWLGHSVDRLDWTNDLARNHCVVGVAILVVSSIVRCCSPLVGARIPLVALHSCNDISIHREGRRWNSWCARVTECSRPNSSTAGLPRDEMFARTQIAPFALAQKWCVCSILDLIAVVCSACRQQRSAYHCCALWWMLSIWSEANVRIARALECAVGMVAARDLSTRIDPSRIVCQCIVAHALPSVAR